MKKLFAILLVLALLTGSALAGYSYNGIVCAVAGSTNIRALPNLNGTILGVLPAGACATYKGSSYSDERGVRWDYICYNGVYGWVSSRFTTLYS